MLTAATEDPRAAGVYHPAVGLSQFPLDELPVRFQPTVPMQPLSLAKTYAGRDLSLYIHIPFCVTRCYFCTFTTVVGRRVSAELIARYLEALQVELSMYASLLAPAGAVVRSVQIGGGTPTTLTAAQLEGLLDFIHDRFNCARLQEIILEAFPTSIDPEKARLIVQFPNLKINLGVQSFDDGVLAAVGRRHEGQQALKAVDLLRSLPFKSVGIDLIYGLPNSTTTVVMEDVRLADQLGVDHLALYPLWVYPRTTLYALQRQGKASVPTIQEKRKQLSAAQEQLEAIGFNQYTVFHSNRYERHEHFYGRWQMEDRDWLGAGQGAVSHLNGVLYQNVVDIHEYMDRASRGLEAAREGRVLDPHERFVRSFLYGLRLWPFPEALFEGRFGIGVDRVFGHELSVLERQGLVERFDHSIRLTPEGVLRLGSIEAYLSNGFDGAEPVMSAEVPVL